MLGLTRATIKKLSARGRLKSVNLTSSLHEVFHENTKLTPTTGRYYGLLAKAFLDSPAFHRLVATPFKKYSLMDREALPAVEPSSELEQTLVDRRSLRDYSGEPITAEELARLCYFTYGRTGPRGYLRPIASGGGLYPLEIYVTAINVEGIEPGLYHYDVEEHHLDAIRRDRPDIEELEKLVWLQDVEDTSKAAMIIYITAILKRSTLKYGDRGYRLVLMEAGQAVHNMALLANSMGFGCCPMGGFTDNDLSAYLEIDGVDEVPLVPLIFGRPAKAAST